MVETVLQWIGDTGQRGSTVRCDRLNSPGFILANGHADRCIVFGKIRADRRDPCDGLRSKPAKVKKYEAILRATTPQARRCELF
jgi:hypothetical protein